MLRDMPNPSTGCPHSAQLAMKAMGQSHQELLDAAMLDALSEGLRGPLAVIKSAAETLRRHGEHLSPGERHEFLRAIVEASERFEGILRHVLPSNVSP